MAKYRDEVILLSNLKLDPANPRHPEFESQREIIEWMTSGTGRIGEKLVALAKDIATFGPNPADRVMVVADEEEKGQFIVLEGNRRLTALKLLNNPDLAPTSQWQKRFSKLRPSQYTPIKEIPCTVFDDVERAFHFIELRHLGESGGAGIVPWEAEQKARHDQRLHRKSRHHRALAVLDFVRNGEGIDSDTKGFAGEGFPITTLDRILSDEEFRNFVGLCINSDGEICFRIEPREALKPISKIIKDFGSGKKNVRHVINKEQRESYRNTFKEAAPDHSRVLAKPVRIVEADTLLTAKARKGGLSGRHYSDPRDRKHVVIPGTSFPIDPARFNRARRVFEELKAVEIRDRQGRPHFVNAGILLVRLFLEMSVDLYIQQHKLKHPSPTGWKNIRLTERTKAVLGDLEMKTALAPQELKVISKALGDVNRVSNPNSLNDFAHNPNQIPLPNDLYDVWDTYTKFLLALWQNVG